MLSKYLDKSFEFKGEYLRVYEFIDREEGLGQGRIYLEVEQKRIIIENL